MTPLWALLAASIAHILSGSYQCVAGGRGVVLEDTANCTRVNETHAQCTMRDQHVWCSTNDIVRPSRPAH